MCFWGWFLIYCVCEWRYLFDVVSYQCWDFKWPLALQAAAARHEGTSWTERQAVILTPSFYWHTLTWARTLTTCFGKFTFDHICSADKPWSHFTQEGDVIFSFKYFFHCSQLRSGLSTSACVQNWSTLTRASDDTIQKHMFDLPWNCLLLPARS